jgi:hypothetical protein
MKKVSLIFAMLLAFAVVAYAQSSDTQSGSSSSSPSASQGSSSSQGSSTTQPDTSTSTESSTRSQGSSTSQGSSSGTYSSGSQGSSTTGGMEGQGGKMKGEKGGKYKGCIRSEGSKFVLEDAHGRTYTLNTSEDLSAHVGHEVLVHGSEGSAAGASAASSATGGAGKEINVTKVDHISDTCKLGKHTKSEKGNSMKSPQ